MERNLQLVWNNPAPQAHLCPNATMLRQLADALTIAIREGEINSVQGLASMYGLTPLALSVVATRMFKAGISEDEILKVV